jgi:hypothetical protein
MKKLLIVVVLVLLAVPAFAANNQVDKGNFSVTLPLFSYSMGMGDLDESSKFTFLAMGYEPEVQYFVMDGLSVGGKVGYKSEEAGGVKTKTTSFGPLANYYLTMIKAPVLPYVGAGLSYEKQGDIKTTTFKAQGGVVYMLGKYLAAYGEVFLGYSQVKVDESVSGPVVGMAAGVKAFF